MQRRLLRRMLQGCVCGLAGEQRHSAKINGSCRDIVFAASSIKSWPEGYLYRFRHAHWRHPGSGRSLFDPLHVYVSSQVGQRTPSHAGRRISWDASRDVTVPIPHRGPAEIVMCRWHGCRCHSWMNENLNSGNFGAPPGPRELIYVYRCIHSCRNQISLHEAQANASDSICHQRRRRWIQVLGRRALRRGVAAQPQ